MAINFVEKRNKLRYLFLILAAFIFIAVIVILYPKLFPKIEPLILPDIEIPVEKIEIDFEVLKHPFLEKLQPFPEIEPYTEEINRENPFMPY